MEFIHGWSRGCGGDHRAQPLGEGGLLRRGEEVVRLAAEIERLTSLVKDCEPSNWSMPMERGNPQGSTSIFGVHRR